jgi:hypothetical protein
VATRADLRTQIRLRLEDTSGSPLWADADLNDYLVEAMRAYGAHFPAETTTATAAVADGVTSVALPAAVLHASRIVAVRDAYGRDVPRRGDAVGPAPADATGLVQAWHAWGATLRFQRPARGDELGAWSIDHLAGRELVIDDVTAQPIIAGDEPIVVALAVAEALSRREVEDVKRGHSGRAGGPAAGARSEANRLIAQRKRRVRGGWLG